MNGTFKGGAIEDCASIQVGFVEGKMAIFLSIKGTGQNMEEGKYNVHLESSKQPCLATVNMERKMHWAGQGGFGILDQEFVIYLVGKEECWRFFNQEDK